MAGVFCLIVFLKVCTVCLSFPIYKLERMSLSVVLYERQGTWQYLHLVAHLELKGTFYPSCASGARTGGLNYWTLTLRGKDSTDKRNCINKN